MKHVLLAFALLLTVCLGVTGCESEKYEVTAWKTLACTAVVYDQTMTELGNLHSKGTITDEVALKAIDFGNKFTPLYLTAVNTLETFVKNPTDSGMDVAKNAIKSAVDSLDLLTDFAKSFGVDKSAAAKEVTDENAKEIATDPSLVQAKE